MSEIESLASAEPVTEHLRRHGLDRLIMLSDGVFAIGITLAAIELRVPDVPTLGEALGRMSTDLLTYLISFMVIAGFWISNRDLFARLQRVDPILTSLTLAMLCVVAVIPAAAHGSQVHDIIGGSMRFYALVMVLSGALNLAMWSYATFRPGLMARVEARVDRIHHIVVAATIPTLFLYLLLIPSAEGFRWIAPIAVAFVAIRRLLVRRLVHSD